MQLNDAIGFMDYKTSHGDTWDSVAFAAYDSEFMSSVLIQANPAYCDVIIFDAGIDLRIPIFDSTATAQDAAPWRQ